VRTPAVFVSGIHNATTLYTTMKTPDKVITSNSITESQIWNAIDIFERPWGVRRTRWEALEINKASDNDLGTGLLGHEQI
jgi:hypothetical protein